MDLSIIDLHALATGLTCRSDWIAWSNTGQVDPNLQPDFGAIPANMRRRMSLASKLALQTALSLISKHTVNYGIFVSRHGELQHTFKLLNDILAGEESSPIYFSQSVHNTASGLFTIASHLTIPVTSIAACQDSFQQGLFEAYARLRNIADEKILLVCYDDLMPDVYTPFTNEITFGYALGLVLQQGNDWRLLPVSRSKTYGRPDYPQALQFYRAYLRQEKTFKVDGLHQSWIWSCRD